ncbi:MAG TPA: SDR family oxidoreductase [Chitinophagaceae bacterium]|nr:SDR family oxidoreductase [Chitinophagaceae bacterium]
MELFSLKDKTCAVTGAGSGIGRAIAEQFAYRGALVHILELDSFAGAGVRDAIVSRGGRAFFHQVHVEEQKDMTRVMMEIASGTGRLDILVNCAGIAHVGKLEDTAEQDFDRLFQVNVKGVYNGMLAVIGQMKAQGGGVILNIASVASRVGIADRFAYSMTKGAVVTMTLSVARDYLSEKIRCNCISPARVHTPFVDGFIAKNYPGKEQEMFRKLEASQPIGRMARPEEVAWLAVYLCSDEASFITGCDYPIDGGFINLNN